MCSRQLVLLLLKVELSNSSKLALNLDFVALESEEGSYSLLSWHDELALANIVRGLSFRSNFALRRLLCLEDFEVSKHVNGQVLHRLAMLIKEVDTQLL